MKLSHNFPLSKDRACRKILVITLEFSFEGDDICGGIRSAAKHWRESNLDRLKKLENLERDCLNAPYHYFGDHNNCDQYFCNKETTEESKSKIDLLKSSGLFHEIINYCNCYFANNVSSLLEDKTNNAAEELNNIIAKYLGKIFVQFFYSQELQFSELNYCRCF